MSPYFVLRIQSENLARCADSGVEMNINLFDIIMVNKSLEIYWFREKEPGFINSENQGYLTS